MAPATDWKWNTWEGIFRFERFRSDLRHLRHNARHSFGQAPLAQQMDFTLMSLFSSELIYDERYRYKMALQSDVLGLNPGYCGPLFSGTTFMI